MGRDLPDAPEISADPIKRVIEYTQQPKTFENFINQQYQMQIMMMQFTHY